MVSELSFKGNERVLDLGCGDGVITALIADQVPQGFVLGIDASHGMIDTARSTYEQSNLQFQVMDINVMDFSDEFDIVVSNATLHWIKDHDKLQANIYKGMRKGGIARLNFAADGNSSYFFKVVREAMVQREFADCFSRFDWPWHMPTVEEYKSLVAKVPFSNQNVWGENADRYFPTVDAMIQWIDQPGMVPFMGYLDTVRQGSFREFVINRMIEETRQADGTCFETFRRMNVLAVK